MDKFTERVIALKGKVMRLAVSGGFHSPFMENAAKELYNYMERCSFRAPSVPVYSNATALPYTEDPRDLLFRQVKSPVLWQKTVENMISAGCTVFIEAGAGKVLSGLVKKISGSVAVYNVEDQNSLQRTAEALTGGESNA
jgi:[acyl-carrier-protein] S-malonyltransferase